MNDFTASNGIRINVADGASGIYLLGVMPTLDQTHATGSVEGIQALREFFQAEADERLGRWRWPENPDYVVYPEGEMVCITNERTGHGSVLSRQWYDDHKAGLLSKEQPWVYAAAGAYFDAHPEPKPWHDAKPGEVWLLTLEGEEPAAFYPSKSLDRHFTPVTPSTGTTAVNFDWPLITAGRRIWPEVS